MDTVFAEAGSSSSGFYIFNETLLVIALVGGAVGGLANFFSTWDKEECCGFALARCLCGGITAGLVVPLFLVLTRSEIISTLESQQKANLPILGVCILAGLFSRRFLESVAKEALKIAKDAHKKADQLDKQRDEPDPEVDPAAEKSKNALSSNERKALNVFPKGAFYYRSFHGLAQMAGMKLDDLKSVLESLKAKGLVSSENRSEGLRFFLTSAGYGELGVSMPENTSKVEPAVGGRPPVAT